MKLEKVCTSLCYASGATLCPCIIFVSPNYHSNSTVEDLKYRHKLFPSNQLLEELTLISGCFIDMKFYIGVTFP